MKAPTKLVVPDGGWGFFVCIGMGICFISPLGSMPSFGLVFGDFLKSIDAETSAITLVLSAFFLTMSFAGLCSSSLFLRFGLRKVGLTGAVLCFTGTVLQIFVNSTITLLIAYSLFQGIGFGLMIPTSYTSFNNYFDKRRVLCMSLAQTLIGVGTMFYPVLMQKLLEWYGFRGCLLVLAAINAHGILGMLMMQPVEWHMRRVPCDVMDLAPLSVAPLKITNMIIVTPATPEVSSEEAANQLSPLMSEHNGSQRHRKLSREEIKALSRRHSSLTSLGNWTGAVVALDASPEMTSMRSSRRVSVISSVHGPVVLEKTRWQIVVDFLDLTLLKQPIYVNIVLGLSFALFSDMTFFSLQPLYLFELNYDKPSTAAIIAIGAAADLASRIFLAVTALFVQVSSRYIYLAGALLTVFARIAFLYLTDFTGMAIITGIMGFLRTWVHVPLPLVLAEYLPKERYASGYGLFMCLQGNIMFALGPVVGYMRDATQSYVLTFHCLNLFMALCAVTWLLEIICLKFKRKDKVVLPATGDSTNNTQTLVH